MPRSNITTAAQHKAERDPNAIVEAADEALRMGLEKLNPSSSPEQVKNQDMINSTPYSRRNGEEESATRLVKIKDYMQIIQSIVTVLAVICTGWWFFLRGETWLRADLSQTVTHRQLNEEWTLVIVIAKITNTGKTPIHVGRGFVRIHQVLPLDERYANTMKQGFSIVDTNRNITLWPLVGVSNAIESLQTIAPGGNVHISFDYIIPSVLKTIQVGTHFEKIQVTNFFGKSKPVAGLQDLILYDLK